MQWTDTGIILSTFRHGEDSLVLRIFTPAYGVHAGLARAGKKSRAIYQPGNIVDVTWKARLEEHLGNFTCELTRAAAGLLISDQDKLAALQAACAMVEQTLPERDPHPELYYMLEDFLMKLIEKEETSLPLAPTPKTSLPLAPTPKTSLPLAPTPKTSLPLAGGIEGGNTPDSTNDKGWFGKKSDTTRDLDALEKAKELRRNSTDLENTLWQHLKANRLKGYKFRRQQSIGPFIVDFVCNEKKLIIELDGSQHKQQQEYDKKRTVYLENYGYKVLRFWNIDIIENLEGVIESIYRCIEDSPSLTLPRKREREKPSQSFSHSWHSHYVLLEIALLKHLGFGLDLESCAATGTKDNLTYVSPKSGRAVSADAGEPYKDKLLKYPDFLKANENFNFEVTEIMDGLKLTEYFLDKYFFQPHNKKFPAARERLTKIFQQ